MNHPRVTVMIPVFNGSKYLRETFRSLQEQTFAEFEVVFADDCSTDGSLAALHEFAAQDSRARVLALPRNLGDAPRVLNEIIKISRGDFIVYSSQDDLFSPDWLEKMVTRADQTGADAVLPDLQFLGVTAPAIVGVHGDRDRVLTNREAVVLALDTVIPGNSLWRSKVVKPTMYPDIGAWADAYASKLFFLACEKVAFCDGVFYYRRDNATAITQKLSTKMFDAPMAEIYCARMLVDNDFPPPLSARIMLRAMEQVLMLAAHLWPLKDPKLESAKRKIVQYLTIFSSPETRAIIEQGTPSPSPREKFILAGCCNGYAAFRLALVCFLSAKKAKRFVEAYRANFRPSRRTSL
jgi:glycosyltransferase involved in cell wall biosynthesis